MTSRDKTLLVGLGLAALGVLVFLFRKPLSALATAALDAANDALFRSIIPSQAAQYSDIIKQVANEQEVDPFVIVALGWRESQWGALLSPPGPGGTGDAGHGRGLLQIDDRTWGDWLNSNNWADPYTNISKGVSIYSDYLDQALGAGLEGDAAVQAAMGAYNHGPNAIKNAAAGISPDTGTTGGNYASDVFGNASNWASNFASALGIPVGQV